MSFIVLFVYSRSFRLHFICGPFNLIAVSLIRHNQLLFLGIHSHCHTVLCPLFGTEMRNRLMWWLLFQGIKYFITAKSCQMLYIHMIYNVHNTIQSSNLTLTIQHRITLPYYRIDSQDKLPGVRNARLLSRDNFRILILCVRHSHHLDSLGFVPTAGDT
jgi:hypothetical protein